LKKLASLEEKCKAKIIVIEAMTKYEQKTDTKA
jgi:hypothetical protein